MGYSVLSVFFISSVLCCVFSYQIKTCCALCCKKKQFAPSVHYDVSDDDVTVVDRQEPASKMVTLTLGDMFENHSVDELLTTGQAKEKETSRVQYQNGKARPKRAAPAGPPKLGNSTELPGHDMMTSTPAALTPLAEAHEKQEVLTASAGVGEMTVINTKFLTELAIIAQGKKK